MNAVNELPIPGGWTEREVQIGEFLFRMWTPAEPDALLERLEEPAAAGTPHFADPYWAKLWPAAPLLAEALVRNRPPAGTRVLELGCGSGLVGVTALACNLDVTFSDYVPLAVYLALQNAARNGLSSGQGITLDWQTDPQLPGDRFDLILAADVTYDQLNLDALLDVVEHRLAAGGQAWFGDTGRSPAPDFVVRALGRGWQVNRYDATDRPAGAHEFGRFERIVLTAQPRSGESP
jgi:predicted nicotinamide N-methyase